MRRQPPHIHARDKGSSLLTLGRQPRDARLRLLISVRGGSTLEGGCSRKQRLPVRAVLQTVLDEERSTRRRAGATAHGARRG